VEKQKLAFRHPARPQPTVLVVENHEEVRDIVGSMVINQGWRALKVATVEEALNCLDRESVDAIVSDWELDDGIGEQILTQAMSVHMPPIPTVMISSYASPELVAQARAAGAVDMLAKPFRIEDLTLLLDRELRMRFVR
jgi:DNA-binding NtrC family response regulator